MEKMEANCVSNEHSSSSGKNTINEEKVLKDVREWISPAIRNRFEKLEHVGIGIRSTCEWTDSRLKVKKHIDVNAYQSHPVETRRQILEEALSSLTDRVTTISVGYILMGAFGLRSCEDVTKYCLTYPKMDVQPTPVQTFKASVGYVASEPSRVKYPEDVDWSHWERSACYLCAALLRLVTKDHENIQRAWEYIGRQYKNFYEESIMLDIEIDPKCALGIRNILQTKYIFKGTIGVFLLAFTQLKGEDMGLCRMLFEQHMSYTGMHAYDLIQYCASKLGVPLNSFPQLLAHPFNNAALRTAMTIWTTYVEPIDDKAAKIAENAKTWKYARLFDSEVFAEIQTKNCPMLTCLLAHMAKKLGRGGTGDVTKIRQIADLPEEQRENMERVADKAIKAASELAGKTPEEIKGMKYLKL